MDLVLMPLKLVGGLISLILNVTGRFAAVIIGLVLMLVGVPLILTVIGAVIGIPLVLLGFILVVRGLF